METTFTYENIWKELELPESINGTIENISVIPMELVERDDTKKEYKCNSFI